MLMKVERILIVTAVSAAFAAFTPVAPALAKHKRHPVAVATAPGIAGASFAAAPRSLPGDYYGTPDDPYGVYWGPTFIGRDPSPAVRRSLLQEYFGSQRMF